MESGGEAESFEYLDENTAIIKKVNTLENHMMSFDRKLNTIEVYLERIMCMICNLERGISDLKVTDGSSHTAEQVSDTRNDRQEKNTNAVNVSEAAELFSSLIATEEPDSLVQLNKKLEVCPPVQSYQEKTVEKSATTGGKETKQIEEAKVPLKNGQAEDKPTECSVESSTSNEKPPSVITVQPLLGDADMKESVRAAVDDFVKVRNIDIIEEVLNANFVTRACLMKFLDYFLEYFLGKKRDQEILTPVFKYLIDSKNNKITSELLADRLSCLVLKFETSENLRFCYHMAMIMGYTLQSEKFGFEHVHQAFKPIFKTNECEELLCLVFEVIDSVKSRLWIHIKWVRSKVAMEDFVDCSDVFLKNNKLEYLNGVFRYQKSSQSPKYDTHLPTTAIKAEVLKCLRKHPSFSFFAIRKWIEDYCGPSPYSKYLICSLMEAICDYVIEDSGERKKLNCSNLRSCSSLIRFFTNRDPKLEVHCLLTICEVMERLNHPKGLATKILTNLYMDVISLAGFSLFQIEGSTLNLVLEEPRSITELKKIVFGDLFFQDIQLTEFHKRYVRELDEEEEDFNIFLH